MSTSSRSRSGATRKPVPAGKGRPTSKRATTGKRTTRTTRKTPLVWLAVGLVVVLAAVLAFLMGGGEETEAAPVEVDGQALPRFGDGVDQAVGLPAPTLSGTGIDGQPLTIEPGTRPTVVLFLAHWCPVCRDEVPRVTEWVEGGNLPAGVDFVAVATDNDANRPNHPPSAWLQGEDWPLPTLLDGPGSPAGQAYGLNAFPYWTFLDADGAVVIRHAGALPVEALENAMLTLEGQAAE